MTLQEKYPDVPLADELWPDFWVCMKYPDELLERMRKHANGKQEMDINHRIDLSVDLVELQPSFDKLASLSKPPS